MNKQVRTAFMIGSWVGCLQTVVGVAATANYGLLGAFFGSMAVYLLGWNGYKWATKPSQEEKPNE